MSLLIIQPNLTSKEAHEWLVDVFTQLLNATGLGEPIMVNLFNCVNRLPYKDADAIFEKAMEGLLK